MEGLHLFQMAISGFSCSCPYNNLGLVTGVQYIEEEEEELAKEFATKLAKSAPVVTTTVPTSTVDTEGKSATPKDTPPSASLLLPLFTWSPQLVTLPQ